MTQPHQYDMVIIGGGPGGYVAAIRAAQLGAKVALVEKDRVGGTCLNRGCIPTKALVRSVEALQLVDKAPSFGVIVEEPAFDFARIMAHKDEVVARLVGGVEGLLKAYKVEVVSGMATIPKPGLVLVKPASGALSPTSNLQPLTSKNIIIATGSVPARPPIAGLDAPGVLTSTEVLELAEMPDSLAVIGGGVIGLEFASIFHALGTRVTVLEMLPTLLPTVDGELARRYKSHLQQAGVEVHLQAQVEGIRPKGDGLVVRVADSGEAVEAEKVLIATGRVPYTEGLGLEELGVQRERGAIVVDEHMATNVPGIYAIGDVTGGIMLAHLASRQGEVAVENILGRPVAMDYRAVPNCVFTLPEIAGVGLTEEEAKAEGLDYQVARFPFSASGRALTIGETTGLVKLICESESGRVLGMHIMGPQASDLIAEGTLAIQIGATARDIAQTIHAHPTLPEAIMEAAKAAAFGQAIHYRKR
ncbi:MAG: dihydrolipoyl dehydrogenase [Chloroflexi bacterium]|nr:dihydrolipoyl dehydrogenase [Chloroflexota bacterium]